jgi:2-iminobutanoate/2-iminopropanoate deaminase
VIIILGKITKFAILKELKQHKMKKEIKSANAPGAIGPYSQAVVAGNLVFVSGQLPIHPETGLMPTDIKGQTAQSISNIEAILAEVGATLDNVVKTTVFLADMSLFGAMNEVYASRFKEIYPARCAFAVKELPKQALVEIEVIAAL